MGAIVGALLVLTSAAGLVFTLTPKTETVSNVLYSYQVKADASYRVHLLPNTLYESEWMDQGAVYAEALTDYIEFHLSASFIGSEPSGTKGTYQVAVIVEGYQGAAENRQSVYRTEFPLSNGDFPASATGKMAMEEVLNIQLEPYRTYAQQAQETLQSSVSNQCTLSLTGTFQADTPYGGKTQDFACLIPLPLGSGTSLYQIALPGPLIRGGEITDKQEVTLPIPVLQAVMAGTAGVAGLSLLVFLLFFTRRPGQEEALRMQAKEIMRKYGSRMSRVKELPDLEGASCVHLADMDSLITLAEELRLPLLYCQDEAQLPRDGLFYSFNSETVYLFELRIGSTPLVTDEQAEGAIDQGKTQ